MKRREFIKTTAAAGLTVAAGPNMAFGNQRQKVRLGLIGVGLRGTWHLKNALERKDVTVRAICDIDPARIPIAQEMIKKAGARKALVYSRGEYDYRRLLRRNDIDAVIISTPWLWHVPMAVAAMKARKYYWR